MFCAKIADNDKLKHKLYIVFRNTVYVLFVDDKMNCVQKGMLKIITKSHMVSNVIQLMMTH